MHEVTMAAIDYLQMRRTILKNPEAMKVNIGRPKTLEVREIKFINLRLIKASEEGCGLTYKVWNYGRTAACLKLRRGSKN